MIGDGSAGPALLGLLGFRLVAVSEQAGELAPAVETTAEQDWCDVCVQVRDLPAAVAR